MRLNTLALAFSLLSLAGTAASAADLSITVKDVHNSTGTVYLVVYDETNFGKPQLAKVRQKAPAAKRRYHFRGSRSPGWQVRRLQLSG